MFLFQILFLLSVLLTNYEFFIKLDSPDTYI